MKSLNPSIRDKKRYVLLRGNNLKEKVEKAILEFIGVLGMSEAGLKFIKTNKDSAIIAVNRVALEKVRASIASSAESVRVQRVSGTLKGLK